MGIYHSFKQTRRDEVPGDDVSLRGIARPVPTPSEEP
jgi:hypothetical protein